MQLTAEQIKGRIRNIAKNNNADARTLLRIHMMERFLERISISGYRDNFIIKGGMLVTALVGVSTRSTMDIDTSIKNQDLSAEDAKRIISEIKDIDISDGVSFEIKDISSIMDEMEYPGIRITMNAIMGNLITPIKVDISAGDIITPHPIEYRYKLLLENRYISLMSYNLETMMAEKIQTVLARGVLNTRMRDFFDIRILLLMYGDRLDESVMKSAFNATCMKRGTTHLEQEMSKIISAIESDEQLNTLWKAYQRKYTYACDISYKSVVDSLKAVCAIIQK